MGSRSQRVDPEWTPSRTRRRGLQMLNVNSTRIACILSILLSITLCMQIMLLLYHDEFVTQMVVMENKLLDEIAAVEDIASDAMNAAYRLGETNYDDEDGGEAKGQFQPFDIHKTKAASWDESSSSKYSMEPMEILKRAGVDPSEGYMPAVSFKQAKIAERQGRTIEKKAAVLPSLEEIQSMYGSKPYIVGLERCEDFRKAVPPINRLMGPAGLFNTATNLLGTLLKMNCVNQERYESKRFRQGSTGILGQAPWGKHNPVSWRLIHSAKFAKSILHQTDFLPVVIIKDPITWMASMCRHGYETRWWRQPQHCPNLVPNQYDTRGGYRIGEGEVHVRIKFATPYIGNQPMPDRKNLTFVNYTSLVDVWNTWYGQWHDVKFPRVMIRFEDLIFHAEETVTKICECGGGRMNPNFRYMEESAKGSGGPHKGSAGFLASLITYGNSTLRMKDILKEENDVQYARDHLDKELMDLFGYASI